MSEILFICKKCNQKTNRVHKKTGYCFSCQAILIINSNFNHNIIQKDTKMKDIIDALKRYYKERNEKKLLVDYEPAKEFYEYSVFIRIRILKALLYEGI